MGLDPRSDPYAAYCFDEAVYRWGVHVEAEVEEATRNAKTDKQREQKIKLTMKRLMNDEREVVVTPEGEEKEMPPVLKAPTKFRDPMSAIRT